MNYLSDNIFITNKVIEIYKNKNLISYLKYGRLPCHEIIKVEILKLGSELGYKILPEYKVKYFLGKNRRGRIDAVWVNNNGSLFSLFEIEEGINTRGIAKLLQTCAKYKFLVMFDVKKKMQKRIDNFDFESKGIFPIQLD